MSKVARLTNELRKATSQVTAAPVSLMDLKASAANLDETIEEAYTDAAGFKGRMDTAEEIPAGLSKIYSRVSKVVQMLAQVHRETHQIRMEMQRIR